MSSNGKHRVVHRDQVSPEIDQTILAWRDFVLELGVGQPRKQFVCAFNLELPAVERGCGQYLFGGQRVSPVGTSNDVVIACLSCRLRHLQAVHEIDRRQRHELTAVHCVS